MQTWQLWAAGAACFAAFTALLTKLGVQGIDAGLATLVRTLVVAIAITVALLSQGELRWWQLGQLPSQSLIALLLSGLVRAWWLGCEVHRLSATPLEQFLARVQADPLLKRRVLEAITADEVSLLAQDLGYPVSGSDLLRFSGKSAAGVRVTRIDHPGEYPGRYV